MFKLALCYVNLLLHLKEHKKASMRLSELLLMKPENEMLVLSN